MATVKRVTTSAVNWTRVAQHVSPQQAESMRAVRAKSEALVTSVNSLPAELPKIDWASFSKTVPVPGLVDKFKKEYESLSVPYPKDVEGWGQLVSEQKQYQEKLMQKKVELLGSVKAAAQQYVKDLDEKLPPADELTLEAVQVYFPGTLFDPKNPDITDHPPLPMNKEVPNFNYNPDGGILGKL